MDTDNIGVKAWGGEESGEEGINRKKRGTFVIFSTIKFNLKKEIGMQEAYKLARLSNCTYEKIEA